MLFVITCSAAEHTAKVTLTGTVTEKATGEPVPGAQIWFPDLRRGTTSKADGGYRMEDLPAVKLLVRISMIGFATITEMIDLDTTAARDFALSGSVTEMNQVVVTGSSKATELSHDPVPTVLLDPRYIRSHASSNAIETLNGVPGVGTLTTGPNVSKPYIRGLGYNRVLTLFDGVRQEGQQWGEEHGVEVDQFLVDRVEVVKGPASLMYGSDALAGVVNLLPAPAVEEGMLKGAVLLEYATNNGAMAGSANVDGDQRGLIWGARLSGKQATNYQNRYDGRVAGTKYAERDASAYAGLDRSWGYAHAYVSLFDDLQEIPDGSRDSTTRQFTRQISEEDTLRQIIPATDLSSYAIGVIHQRVQHYRAHVASNVILGNARLAANLAFQRSIRREYSHPGHADIAGLYLVLNTFSYDLKYHLAEKKGWEPTFGLNGMVQHNDADQGTEFVIPTYNSVDAGPFAHMWKRLARLDLSAGVRYDVRHFSNATLYTRPDAVTGFDRATTYVAGDTNVVQQFAAYDHTFNGLSGSMGAAFTLNERITLKANVARGYRAPNAAEISAKGVHPGTGFEQLGDADLRPEFNVQEDIGVFYAGTHVNASVELFHNMITDYIYNEKLANVAGGDSLFEQGGNVFPVFKFKQTGARLYGGEVSIDIHPHPLDWLHFENALSVVLAENTGGGGALIGVGTRYLPFIPPLHTTSELRADLKKPFGRLSGVFIKLGVQVFAAQDRFFGAYGTETFTPGYTLLDAGLGADVHAANGNTLFSFTVLGSNLADVAYQSNMSRLKYMDDSPVNWTGRSGIYNISCDGTHSTSLSFAAGQTTQTVTVPVAGDTASEADENFFVNLSSATGGATIGDSQGVGTIRAVQPVAEVVDELERDYRAATERLALYAMR